MGQTKQREGEDELKMKSEQNHFKWMGAEDHFLVLESDKYRIIRGKKNLSKDYEQKNRNSRASGSS